MRTIRRSTRFKKDFKRETRAGHGQIFLETLTAPSNNLRKTLRFWVGCTITRLLATGKDIVTAIYDRTLC